MAAIVTALVAGFIFGAGLAVSQMINPAKVLAFLNFGGIPSGAWDPSLAVVMAAALVVTFLGYRFAWRSGRPLFAPKFSLPTRRGIDRRLVLGATLFGAGWGLVGFCPGPAIAALGQDGAKTLAFVICMLIGMGLFASYSNGRPSRLLSPRARMRKRRRPEREPDVNAIQCRSKSRQLCNHRRIGSP